ncbi:hypothetical protein EON66_10845 [archaeon]|nr:MAG: hypothetical protein EON66_10845 [archaeon]
MWPFFVITDEYKARKEAFVFGHVGSSLTDVLLCLYTVPVRLPFARSRNRVVHSQDKHTLAHFLGARCAWCL